MTSAKSTTYRRNAARAAAAVALKYSGGSIVLCDLPGSRTAVCSQHR
jgi:hypothetical protein